MTTSHYSPSQIMNIGSLFFPPIKILFLKTIAASADEHEQNYCHNPSPCPKSKVKSLRTWSDTIRTIKVAHFD